MLRILMVGLAALSLTACQGKAKENLNEAQTFMAANAKAEGVKTLPSGVQYKIVKSGPATGLKAGPDDEVKVHYEGKLVSGIVFDSSYERGSPVVMPLKGLIAGWTEALQLMRPGDEWLLYVPPEQGYGKDGRPPVIPPNSALIFRIELLGVLPAPTPTATG